jgi:hypothetical protein
MNKKILLFILILTACQPATPQATPSASSPPAPDSPQSAATYLPAESPPRGAENEFTTDFNKHSVPYSEILSGGPPKDGIPSIDQPQFIPVNDARLARRLRTRDRLIVKFSNSLSPTEKF